MPKNINFPKPDDPTNFIVNTDSTKFSSYKGEKTGEDYFESEQAKKHARRLLGLNIKFDTFTPEDKKIFLISEQRQNVFENISTTTMPVQAKSEQKRGIVSEVLRENLISTDILKNYPIVYLGSDIDIEYPLAIGGRNIEMIDYLFTNDKVIQMLVDKIKLITGKDPEIHNQNINFKFDFGEGEEGVTVKIQPVFYHLSSDIQNTETNESYTPPEHIGVILAYAAQGPSGKVTIGPDLKSKIVNDGIIIEDTHVIKIDNNTGIETKLELGEKED